MGLVRNAHFVRSRAVSLITLIAWSVSLLAPYSVDAQTTASTTAAAGFSQATSTNSVLGSIPMPAYNQGLALGAGSIFGACANLAQTIQNAAANGGVMNGSGSTGVMDSILNPSKASLSQPAQGNACQMTSTPIDDSSKECDDFNSDPKKIQAAIAQEKAVGNAIACQTGELDTVSKELSCLSEQGTQLTSQIASLQQAYTTNIQLAQQGVQKYAQVEADRATQITDVNTLLNGDSSTNATGSGKTGLRTALQNVQTLAQGMQTQQVAIQKRVAGLAESKTQFQRVVQIDTAALTRQCFQSTPVPGFRCIRAGSPGSVDVSPEAYIACMYGFSKQGTESVADAQTAINVQQGQATAQSYLDAIMNAMPSGTTLPPFVDSSSSSGPSQTDQSAAIAYLSQNTQILTPSDLTSSSVNSGLDAALNSLGPQYAAVATQQLQNCYNQANAKTAPTVDPSTGQLAYSDPTLEIYMQGINTATTQLQTDVNGMVTAYQSTSENAWAALTGKSLVPDVSQCLNVATNELACVNSMEANLNDLANGQTSATAATIQIPSTIAGQTITTQCQGLQGCITQLESLSTFLTNDKTAVHTAKQAYIQQANQQIQQFTTAMTQAFSPAAQSLGNQLKSINLTLQTLGVNPGVTINKVDKVQLEPGDPAPGDPAPGDTAGLYKVPTNVLGLIGGNTSPQMIDLASEDFSSSASGIGNQEQTLKSNSQIVASSESTLQDLLGSCAKKKLGEDKEKLAAQLATVNQQCTGQVPNGVDPEVCSTKYTTAASGFNTIWDAMTVNGEGSDGSDMSAMNDLNTGFDCTTITTVNEQLIELNAAKDYEKAQALESQHHQSDGKSGPWCESMVSTLTSKASALQKQYDALGSQSAQ